MSCRLDGRFDMERQDKGVVFNIQRYSIHDGPGIRTIVFLKGCPLRCEWCCNPESQELMPELSYIRSACSRCLYCIGVCPQRAMIAAEDGIIIDMDKCDRCFECVAACASGALKTEGRIMTVGEVLEEVMKDEPFYSNSGGGITLSGGEVMVQHSFASAILKAAKEKGIGTAIETSGYGSWDHLLQVLEYTDHVLYDLKHTDDKLHIEGTGVSLSPILENLYRVARSGKELTVRVPLIPGYNMDRENILKTIEVLISVNKNEVHILPFHQLGSLKYENLNRDYRLSELRPPSDTDVESIKRIFEEYGIMATVGG